ncbi:hypothetical protein [Roseibium sp. M-1]
MKRNIVTLKDVETISIVGNGPISDKEAPLIDQADFVLRFNSAPACGAAGQRVDVLLLNRARVYMSKRINPIALQRAREVWVNDIEENGRVDWHFETECQPRYLGFGPSSKARKHLEKYDPFHTSAPTTGASIIAEFLDTMPGAQIHLFGFSHEGKQHTHDWDAEKRWIGDLAAQGRLVKHLADGAAVKRSVAGKAEYCARLVEMRTKHYLYNRILHSQRETKGRIFGKDA